MSVCAIGWWDRGPPSVGCDLLLSALWRSECSHAGCEQSATSARRLQDLVSGVHEQPRQTVRASSCVSICWDAHIGQGGSVCVVISPLVLSYILTLDPCPAAFPQLQRTSFASITAECWGTALTLTRELSTAWSGNVTSLITTERWQTRLKTTSGLRYCVLHFAVFPFGLFCEVQAFAHWEQRPTSEWSPLQA